MDPQKNPELKEILRKFDERVYFGTQPLLNVFRKFDKDGDGYVSAKDMRTRLQELNLLKP